MKNWSALEKWQQESVLASLSKSADFHRKTADEERAHDFCELAKRRVLAVEGFEAASALLHDEED